MLQQNNKRDRVSFIVIEQHDINVNRVYMIDKNWKISSKNKLNFEFD